MGQEREILQMITTRLTEANVRYMVTAKNDAGSVRRRQVENGLFDASNGAILVIVSLKEKIPNPTWEELRRALFFRFYRGDFDKKTSEKILATLAKAG